MIRKIDESMKNRYFSMQVMDRDVTDTQRKQYCDTLFKNHTGKSHENDHGENDAMIMIDEKELVLHHKHLSVSYLHHGVHDSVEAMETLVEAIVEESAQKHLLTLVQSNDVELFESLGFETVVDMYRYNMNSSIVPEFGVDGIVLDPKSEELLSAYQNFSKHFDGYFERDIQYYDEMKQYLKSMGGSIVGLTANGKLVGYLLFINYKTSIEVLECCYDKSGTLLKLLSFASRGKARIVMYCSVFEKIEKILPESRREKVPFILAKVNDQELFERLFHIKIISAYSAFNAFGKAIWNRDFY